ncbi:MAG: hypothetical protein R3F29_07020 [Planctomycetota bacterium]
MSRILLTMALAATLSSTLSAQVVVRRPGNNAADSLRATIARLVDGHNAVEAHALLLRSGPAAVPLLAAEVERDGPAAGAALFVLVELGCDAAPAVPVLRRAALAEGTAADRRADIERAIAAIDGPAMLLVPVYQENLVIEYDLAGNERRKVAFDNPWCAWPTSGDGVGALCYGHGRIENRTWEGKELSRRAVPLTTAWCYEVGAADLVRSDFEGKGMFARIDGEDEERWRVQCNALRVLPLVDGRVLVLDRGQHRLLVHTGDRQDAAIPVDDGCVGMRPLPGGGFLLSSADKVIEVDAEGQQVREWTIGGRVHDAWLLRDGRLVVTTNSLVQMLDAEGKVLWKHDHRMSGPLFVRQPASGGR